MPFIDVVARVAELEALNPSTLAQPSPVPEPAAAATGGVATGGLDFPQLLAALAAPSTAAPAAGGASRTLAAAESQVGQAEQPPGSNDGPAVAMYRSAVAGAQPGEPWCAYFASWAGAQGGTPIGDAGQGLGSVAEITDWAQRTGRYLPAGSTPQPGDLILFGDDHVGIVQSVNPDGSLTTVEGNYDQSVSRVNRMPSEATGYVRL